MVTKFDVSKVQGALKSVIEYFEPFGVECRNVTINYEKNTSEIQIFIRITEGVKNKFFELAIPAYDNFEIKKMQTQDFSLISGAWYIDDSNWKINKSRIPKEEIFYITLEGKIDPAIIKNLVYVQHAANRDSSNRFDKYWLRALIRNVNDLEDMWHNLEVEDVNIGVDVSIIKAISISLPPELTDISMKTTEFIKAGQDNDRNKLYNAWRDLHKANRNFKIDYSNILKVLNEISQAEHFVKYLSTKPPFYLGTVRRTDLYAGYIPQKMSVQIITRLSLSEPSSSGYLIFEKANFSEFVKSKFGLVNK